MLNSNICFHFEESFMSMPSLESFDVAIETCEGRDNLLAYEERAHVRGPLTNSNVWINYFDKLSVGNVLNCTYDNLT